jgi:hypothetical protein
MACSRCSEAARWFSVSVRAWAAIFATLLLLSIVGCAPASPPDTPAGRALQQFLQAFDSGDPDQRTCSR